MADEDTRYRSLTTSGMGADAAVQLVRRALEGRSGLVVREIAPGRISVARTRRPRWAVVACACTFWLGGLGFLFLLVRQTDAGEITVTDAPQGCVVIVPPLLRGAPTDAVEAALRGPAAGPSGGAAPPFATSEPGDHEDADALDSRTVARQAPLPPPPSPPAPPPHPQPVAARPSSAASEPDAPVAAVQFVLRFDEGTVTVGPDEQVVIGRDPSPRGSARAAVVPGDASSVSKSHLLVVSDGAGATVEDLGSTNGSALLRHDQPVPLEPGTPVRVADGDLVVLGAVSCIVEQALPGSDRPTTPGSVP